MTLTDDLHDTAAALKAGWPIENLNRARRVRAEQEQEMITTAQKISATMTAADGLTDDESASLQATKSEIEWDAACDAIKAARGGAYPHDWWPLVQMSSLMARQVASWKKA